MCDCSLVCYMIHQGFVTETLYVIRCFVVCCCFCACFVLQRVCFHNFVVFFVRDDDLINCVKSGDAADAAVVFPY